jgi:prevent-host-death family protein
MSIQEIGIEQARHQLGEIVDRARLVGQPTRITRQGKAAAVIVNVNWYEAARKMFAAEVQADVDAAHARLEDMDAEGEPQ